MNPSSQLNNGLGCGPDRSGGHCPCDTVTVIQLLSGRFRHVERVYNMPTHAHAIARMDRASDKVKQAFDQLNSYEEYYRRASFQQKAGMEKRVELRGMVMSALGLPEEVAQDAQVMQVFDLLSEKEYNLAQHNGSGVAKCIQVVKETRALVETTAKIVAEDMGGAPVPKRPRLAQPEAAGGAARDFVDLTEDDE